VEGNPLASVDLLGLKPGDPFESADAAALDALNYINPVSIEENIEYAGAIYRDPATGSYYAFPPDKGGPKGSNEWRLSIPSEVDWVGDYHTHGNYSDSKGCPSTKARDVHKSDQFSRPDRWWRPSDRADKSYTRYLGTPSGAFLKMKLGGTPERLN
jgi:hypothetical protein